MMPPPTTTRRIRFAAFEIDFKTGELHKSGCRVRLQDQPLKILEMLVEHPGEVVTREELQQAVWSTDTFVDFEQGLNKAVNKLREALGDTAERPRFIETLPRRGYRFVAKVEVPPPRSSEEGTHTARTRGRPGGVVGIVAAGLTIGLGALLALNVGNFRDRLLTAVGARPGVSRPKIDSIAVLPLENLTGDPQKEWFVDGIHDELITQLAQVNSLKVISRYSVMRYRKEKPSLRQIGEELDVSGVLEGAVRREGDRLHVTAQLIVAREDRHIWARSYDRDKREAWAIPGEIARAVTETLNIKLTAQERLLLGRAQPVDPDVYTAYLKGKDFVARYTNEGYHRAIEFFQQAIDRDPGYAPAWAEMGDSYESLRYCSLPEKDLSEQEALQKASAALERALELDPHPRNPHQDLMRMKLNKWDWDGAATEDEKTRERDTALKSLERAYQGRHPWLPRE